MGVTKFYAYYEKSKNEFEIIDAFEGLNLAHELCVIKTKPKELAQLYDVDTFLKVLPVRGRYGIGLPHFSYYKGEDSPLKGQQSSLELTIELKSFIKAFEAIESFRIEEYGENPITIYPKKMQKLKRVETSESFVILKFLIDLKETKPYSAFYRFNGVLGLEFSVTSQPESIKCKELGEKGIPLFRSNVQFPSWMGTPEEDPDEKEFEQIVKELVNTYQNRNYRLYGDFINQSINFPEYKEKYVILNDFERQCEELKLEKSKLKSEIEEKKKRLEKIEEAKVKQKEEIEKLEEILITYRNELDTYEKIKQENSSLDIQKKELQKKCSEKNDLVEKLREETIQLSIENGKISKNNKDLSDKNKKLKDSEEALVNQLNNKGILNKLFNRRK